jgi:ATP-dependent DNA helicase RecQ
MAQPRVRQKAAKKPARRQVGALDYDRELFERLRLVRKKLADAAGVPPFVIFSDTALAEMATYLPADDDSFLRIPGVGLHKLKQYGPAFLAEIRQQKGAAAQ